MTQFPDLCRLTILLSRSHPMDCFAYIMASSYRGTLYVGVTSNLIQRTYQHKQHTFKGFTSLHDVDRLVWYEGTPDMEAAIGREKQIKNWKRDWKIALVEGVNPNWRDLYSDLLGEPPSLRT